MSKAESQWVFTDVQNLLRHRKSGKFYGRFRVGGKRKFIALQTDKKTIAKLRLHKKAAEIEQQRHAKLATGSEVIMSHLFGTYRERFQADSNLSAGTKKAKEDHVLRIEKTWPALLPLEPESVTPQAIVDWANRLHSTERFVITGTKKKRPYSAESVNKSVDALRNIFKIAVERGALLLSPFSQDPDLAKKLKKTSQPRRLDLPSRADMDRVIQAIRNPVISATTPKGFAARHQEDAQDVCDLVEGLCYSGMRLREAGRSISKDFGPDTFFVRGTKSADSQRTVPINPKLRALVDSIRKRRALKPNDPLFRVKEAEKTLTRVCAEVGVARLRHHDLRHYFATVCIESGVDFKTLAEWLGHSDGGVLAMRTYSHLRSEHSLKMASRVVF
jgi:integrase